jgi:predicted RNA-binding Zn-ribbon protein involved in translation (DUF1610 family)
MRLTKDLKTPHDDTTYNDVVKDAVDREDIVLTKLKHYEDLEELGYDTIEMKKLINRDIAKKPIAIFVERKDFKYICPECGIKLNKEINKNSWDIKITSLTNYCPNCGQKLEWK